MKTLNRRACVGLLAALPLQSLFAQRMVGGGLNYAPLPAVYAVVLDGSRRAQGAPARCRRTHRRRLDSEGVFDLSTLKAGDEIRVDFVAPDKAKKGLTAAQVWLVK